jgi:hypothetical protein
MKRVHRLSVLAISAISILMAVRWVRASVTLVAFNAIPDDPNKSILLFWETGSELDFAGFYIERSLNIGSGFEPLSDEYGQALFFPTKGESAGAHYSYSDADVEDGMVYYYRLKLIDLSGYFVYSDVVSAMLPGKGTPIYLPLIMK